MQSDQPRSHPASVAPDGPFEIEIKLHVKTGDNVGIATAVMPAGEFPTAETVTRVIRAAQKQLGPDYVLMGRHDFLNELLAESTLGVRVAVPGPDSFSVDWSA